MLKKIPHGLDEILRTYGDPASNGFESRNIISVTPPYTLLYGGAPVKRIRCHRLAADHFLKAFECVKAAGLSDQLKEFNGLYVFRPIRGLSASFPSLHSWGVAIDLEAYDPGVGDRVTHALGSSNRLPDRIVKCFRDAGFFYGGDFKSRKDPMHFQLATGY